MRDHTTDITNREQTTRNGGIVRSEETPYKKAVKEKPWKDPRRIIR